MAARMATRLTPKNSVLFVCDMQDRFRLCTQVFSRIHSFLSLEMGGFICSFHPFAVSRNTIQYFPAIVETSKRMVDAARILQMPIVVTEQYPKGLGHTIPELGLDDVKKYQKTKVSRFYDKPIRRAST